MLDEIGSSRISSSAEIAVGTGSATVRGWSVDNEVAINQKEKYAKIRIRRGMSSIIRAEQQNSKLKLFATLLHGTMRALWGVFGYGLNLIRARKVFQSLTNQKNC